MPTILITGSSGLVGSACARLFHARGWMVHGIDSNARAEYFGPDGDNLPTLRSLRHELKFFTHHPLDVCNRRGMSWVVENCCPDAVIHAAAQPSHDWATRHPVQDWQVNATGTLNMLEAVREHVPGAAFVFLSTNKVYGDACNELPVIEEETRYEYVGSRSDRAGLGEWLWARADRVRRSIFGASKAAADLLTQEYGRTFGMRTACLRCGCLTGSGHAGAELHGFLAYLAKCCKEGRPYTIHGYKGKQVRDQLHADDVALACHEIIKAPRVGEVYNLGGGRDNSISVLEAITAVRERIGKPFAPCYSDTPRGGDHIVWITDTAKFRSHYPNWKVTRSLDSILDELCGAPVGV